MGSSLPATILQGWRCQVWTVRVIAYMQVICEVGKAVGAEGLVAGQIVDIKSEGMRERVRLLASCPCPLIMLREHLLPWVGMEESIIYIYHVIAGELKSEGLPLSGVEVRMQATNVST